MTSLRELQAWMRDPSHCSYPPANHSAFSKQLDYWKHRSEPTLCCDAQRLHILPRYSIPALRILIGLRAHGQSRQLEMQSLFCELHASSPPATQSPDRSMMMSMTPYSKFRTDSYRTACSYNGRVSHGYCYRILSPTHARNIGVVTVVRKGCSRAVLASWVGPLDLSPTNFNPP